MLKQKSEVPLRMVTVGRRAEFLLQAAERTFECGAVCNFQSYNRHLLGSIVGLSPQQAAVRVERRARMLQNDLDQ